MKKIIATISAAVLAFTGTAVAVPAVSTDAAESTYNYAEALQKSMFFYEVQQSGELPDWNEVSWRDDCMTNDYVSGGFFDAGDHLKFALTNAYTGTLLGWGLYQYEDGVKNSGQYDLYCNNLEFCLDYLVGCDLGDEVVYMIGDGSFDHTWWGSAEVYMAKYELQTGETQRPYYTCEDSCIDAQMAAALTTGYLCFKDSDDAEKKEKAEVYMTHAKDLFERANTLRALGDDAKEDSYYQITTFYDDLLLAANWLYIATGEQSYLDTATELIPYQGKEEQSTDYKYTWGYCWDDVTQGAFLLYAMNTGDSTWIEQVRKHLEYWTTGYGGKQVSYTPDGLAWLFQWGSTRHATTTAFIAQVAADTIFADDATAVTKYETFAKSQMDYCFGDNDLGMSYVQGMGDKTPNTFHHRTASGIHDDHWQSLGLDESESEGWQTEYAHTLYGALEGGPNQDGTFTDEVGAYQCTEVAIDYNAGYTAMLCALNTMYDNDALSDFPPTESPKWAEFEISAVVQQNQSSYTQIQLWAMNHSAWPARVVKDLSYNYYFDVTEVLEAGLTVDDITVSVGYDQHASDDGKLTASEIKHYKDNIYYVNFKFGDGSVVMPTGQSEHRSEAQIRISIPDAINGKSTAGAWDPTNDYSFQGLSEGGQEQLKSADAVTPYITMYDGDTLIWGTEPDGTTASDVTTTQPAVTTTTEATTTTTTTEATTAGVTTPESTTATETALTTETTTVTTTATETALTTETTTVATKDTSEVGDVLYGDVNLDNAVDMTDIIVINKMVSHAIDANAQQTLNGDLDINDSIDGIDAKYLLQFVIHQITELPVVG